MEQDLIKLMADSMSAFNLFHKDPKSFDWNWLQKHYGLSNTGLSALQNHMNALINK